MIPHRADDIITTHAVTLATSQKERRPQPTPLRSKQPNWSVTLFLCAGVGLSIPHAASLHAIRVGLRGRHVSGEGWTGECKCEGHCKNRYKSFHDVYSLTLDLKSCR